MAKVVLTMTAQSYIAEEKCAGCASRFDHAEQMSAVEHSGGDPAGWFCAPCVRQWRDTGVQPTPHDAAERE